MKLQNILRTYFPTLQKLAVLVIFFIFTPVTLFVSAFSLISLSKYGQSETLAKNIESSKNSVSQINVYSSYAPDLPSISAEIIAADAREQIIIQYLDRYNSPLVPYAGFIVQNADKYGIDFRLITAIAQQESNLCKKIPEDSFNCWGWGIHSRGTLRFDSYESGIETVSKGLKTQYIDKGYTNPNEIMSKYTPLSNGSWADGVNKFLTELN